MSDDLSSRRKLNVAWIESHQALERHPKTLELMNLMGWDLDTTIGKLHRFWWWCVDYAEDGDLRKHSHNRIGASVGLNGDESQKFIQAMLKAGWLDHKPYFRIHDWWDYVGLFMQRKYGDKKRHIWERIKKLYENKGKINKKDCTITVQQTVQQLSEPTYLPTYLPNLPNLTNLTYINAFSEYWLIVPARNGKKIGKEETFKKFCELPEEKLALCIQAVKNYADSELIQKGIGIKDPIRFLWDGKHKKWFWEEWIEPEQKTNIPHKKREYL